MIIMNNKLFMVSGWKAMCRGNDLGVLTEFALSNQVTVGLILLIFDKLQQMIHYVDFKNMTQLFNENEAKILKGISLVTPYIQLSIQTFTLHVISNHAKIH